MKTQIFKNYKEFRKREDKTINGVTKKFAEKHGINLEKNEGNTACWNCNHCHKCDNCERCKNCEYLFGAIGYINNKEG